FSFSCFTGPGNRMFSSRIAKNAPTNALTLAIQRRRDAGAPVFDLTESNPTRSGIEYDQGAISRALSQPGIMRYEPHPQGIAAARSAVAGYYRERGVVVDPDSLVLASGTSEAYGYLFKLLADPGSDILVPVPGYPLLEVLTSLEAMRLVPYRSLYSDTEGWQVDLERLANTVSNRTKAIVVVSPNNPTGAFLKTRELAGMAELCRRFGLALIVDEVFSDYASTPGRAADPQRVISAAGHDEALTFVLNGLSKIVGLPQLKLAWIHVSGPQALKRQAIQGLEFIADAYLSVSTPVQLAAEEILGQRGAVQRQILPRLQENESFLKGALRGTAHCRVLAREGGWYAVVRLPKNASDEEICLTCLEEDGVLVHPGYFYDFPSGNHLVLSLLTPTADFRQGAARMAERLARLKAGTPDGIVGA
ncbi:MAG TPA: pyridoxal phosphate-dependent aminotransferase, partial [Spirochaetia bacterium]|nr:pyridoxal phosphate-dependent aminotransferase [Spirochaetia bacterium]